MREEKLRGEDIALLREYGLGGVDNTYITLCIYESGEFIMRQGYPSPHVYIVLNGKMKVFTTVPNGRTLLICYYSSQVILGEVEFALNNDSTTSSVQAIAEVSCIRIPRERYQREMQNSIPFMNAVSNELAQKLFHCNKNSAATILHSLDTRLCAYIANTNSKGYFKETLTEIAAIMGTSYRHLLRTLDNLCGQGVLEKTPQGYRIVDMAALKRRSDRQ